MRRRPLLLVLAAIAIVAVCLAGWVVASPCSGAERCAAVAMPAMVLIAALLLAGGSVMAWLTATAWLLMAARRDIGMLPVGAAPAHVLAQARRLGLDRVRWLATDAPIAFCARGLRPEVFISAGLARALPHDELAAVILHESQHRRRYEPLRRAARRASAGVCFYVPLVRWWAERQLERSEVDADALVLRHLGPAPLARALCRVDGAASGHSVAAFGGAAEVRVAQLLGDPLPRRRPPAWTWSTSAAGILSMMSIVLCVSPVLGRM